MDPRLEKPYNPTETEPQIYSTWEKSGFFNPDNLPPIVADKTQIDADNQRESASHPQESAFCLMMPPPNVTGVLHMGHALAITLEDIMVRYARMKGKRTLWLPGTDHAAIATQSKVEKEIYKKEGKNRYDLGREEMLKRIGEFAQASHDTIVSQIRTMGASCDWSREAFTFDDKRNRAVNTVFKMMYDDGLIYRGHRIVNWDPKGQTTISDDEIVYKEEKTTFYYFKYGPFVIGTSRPETKFGDKYVVMHPADKRYAEYQHGQQIDLEWINGPITATVIKDESIDMEFGTGVMTITPWHSMVDFDIAERHGLDKEQIIDERGKLLPIAGEEFAGLKITDARPKIVEKLRAKGLVVKEEDYTHNVATAERTGGIIEPQIKLQWFVNVNKPIPTRDNKTLKELMREPVADGRIKILPDHFEKIYYHWIDNLRDWCISRQIWYGHRVPVWYRNKVTGDRLQVTAREEETEIYCGERAPDGEGWAQDEDTLDTWFSSGLWTFSTLGWPDKTEDLKLYHPTTMMETGYEILFFWIARMILMSQYVLGEIPFSTVYLHGTIRDAQGRKMSKSLGNGIDPVEMSQKWGTDAVRMSLIVGNTPGTDMRIAEDKIKAYKHFANKLWNITRFILSYTDKTILDKKPELTAEDQKNIEEFDALTKDITDDMENFRYYLAAEKLYHYAWHTLADKLIEDNKNKLNDDNEVAKASAQYSLFYILYSLLKLLHPFMPFITEEIWGIINGKDGKLLLVENWPLK